VPTRAYREGRRASYLDPLRMFLFFSVVVFFAPDTLGDLHDRVRILLLDIPGALCGTRLLVFWLSRVVLLAFLIPCQLTVQVCAILTLMPAPA
jgi:hypothetical protein